MVPYATVDDLLAGWPGKEMGASERVVATESLERATAYLSALLKRHGVEVDGGDEVQMTNLKTVACNMVRRAMSVPAIDGLSSMSQTIGSTTASVNWSNPGGGFYLTKADKDVLGLTGGSTYRAIRPFIGPEPECGWS